MKKLISLMTILGLSLALMGCTTAEPEVNEPEISEEELEMVEQQILEAEAIAQKQEACEDSGGTFAYTEEECTCPDETYGENLPLYTFDEETGYCIDAFGIPGGELGEEAKEDHPLSE